MKKYFWILTGALLLLSIYMLVSLEQIKQERYDLQSQVAQATMLLDSYTSASKGEISREELQIVFDSIYVVTGDSGLYNNYFADLLKLVESMKQQTNTSTNVSENRVDLSSTGRKDIANERLESFRQLYEKLLEENLALTDTIIKWKEVSRKKDMLTDSIKYTGIEKRDSLQKIIKQQKSLNNRKLINFNSPGGVRIYYLGDVSKQGLADGFGVGVYANGNVYEGQWKNGKKHGEGIYSFSDGEVFEGTFKEDKRTGYGQYKWKNGDLYKGNWENDLRHGKGIILDNKGNIKQSGTWEKDKLVKEGAVEF
jgi:hypothetical protein